MNKDSLFIALQEALKNAHSVAVKAAQQAHDTATHEENVAENKYDTLGLEASYLAHGQSQRVAECEEDIQTYRDLTPKTFNDDTPISIGALVKLLDEEDVEQWLYLGPRAGGLKFACDGKSITVVTTVAPLGRALLNQRVGDEVYVSVGETKTIYEITAVY